VNAKVLARLTGFFSTEAIRNDFSSKLIGGPWLLEFEVENPEFRELSQPELLSIQIPEPVRQGKKAAIEFTLADDRDLFEMDQTMPVGKYLLEALIIHDGSGESVSYLASVKGGKSAVGDDAQSDIPVVRFEVLPQN
jgi:hypothetical protein